MDSRAACGGAAGPAMWRADPRDERAARPESSAETAQRSRFQRSARRMNTCVSARHCA